jgi:transcriptional regulator with XRE-family HTH domain
MSSVRGAFALALRQLRGQSALTQQKLAEASNLSAVYVWELENAENSPSLETIHKLARALHMSMGELLDSVEEQLGEVQRGDRRSAKSRMRPRNK